MSGLSDWPLGDEPSVDDPITVMRYGHVLSVDEEYRSLTVSFDNFNEGTENVAILSFPGDRSLPMENDRVCCLIDFAERYAAVGVVETVYKAKVDGEEVFKVRKGEILHQAKSSGSYLYLDKNQNIELSNAVGSRISINAEEEEISFQGRTLRVLADVGELAYGVVKRAMTPFSSEEVVEDITGTTMKEFFLDVTNSLGRLAKLVIGNVYDDSGAARQSAFLQDLRFALDIFGQLGIQVSSLQVDEAGNATFQFNGAAEIDATAVVVDAFSIQLGDSGAVEPAVKGGALLTVLENLATWVFAHRHDPITGQVLGLKLPIQTNFLSNIVRLR